MVQTGVVLALLLPVFFSPAKPEKWLEVRSPNFVVVTNSGEKDGRRVAEQFERFRAVMREFLPRARVDPAVPVTILAVKDEESFRDLLPEQREKKGQVQWAGVFQRGPGKSYVALRNDVYGPDRYQLIYHEYVHLLTDLNVPGLPLWLGEGLAEFFANADLDSDRVKIGRPDERHIWLLRDRSLLPLEELMSVDRTSRHYNEAEKATIFYAQSWALTHYLRFAPVRSASDPLGEYLRLLGGDLDEMEARRRAFGDLGELEKELRAYVRRLTFSFYRTKGAAEVDPKSFTARQLAPAESAAVRGDFHVYRQRPIEARALLDEALLHDPSNAPALESMGLLHVQQGDRREAARWFTRAVARESASFLAHYYHATLSLEEARESPPAETQRSLRRAIEMNPQFAPAHVALASLLARDGENLEEALRFAQKGASLEPNRAHNHLNVGYVFLAMGRPAAALQVGQQVQARFRGKEDQEQVASFLEQVRQYQEYQARVREAEEKARAEEEERKRLAAKRARTPAIPDPPANDASPPRPRSRSMPRESSARGVIGAVTCAPGGGLELTLHLAGSKLQLRAPDRRRIRFAFYGWTPPATRFDPCQDIKLVNARIRYTPVKGQPYAGEIVFVELSR